MSSALASGTDQSLRAKEGTSLSGDRGAFLIALAMTALTLLGLCQAILKLNYGQFTYTLDDPYITLSVSDQIRHGGYGINTGEHSAPESSILFPFLLAPGAGTALAPLLPLILNSLSLFLTLFILHRFFSELRILPADRFGNALHTAAIYLIAICLNLIAVVFTGMEHSLHCALTAAGIYGLARFLDEGEYPKWLPWVLVISPLIRYEGLVLSCAALVILALRGKWRTAAVCFCLIFVCLASFSLFLVSMGLPPMPSSILAKSAVVAHGVGGIRSGGLLQSMLANAWQMGSAAIGIPLLFLMFEAALLCKRELKGSPRVWSSRGLMTLTMMSMIAGHALGGRMGWLNRYEDYLLLGTLMLGVYVFQDMLRAGLAGGERVFWACALAPAVLFFVPYIGNTFLTPVAANNIFEQQYQMHRFVCDYWRAPVAVNDIGRVSYQSRNYVLDLYGLASNQARTLRETDAGADAYRRLVKDSGVRLAIVYDSWFVGRIPASWQKLATMSLSRRDVSPAFPQVEFYATDPNAIPVLRSELDAFKKSLPPRVELVLYQDQQVQPTLSPGG